MPTELLTADDPAPVRVLRPDGTSDLFLTADHAGRALPSNLGRGGAGGGPAGGRRRRGERGTSASPR